MPKIVFIESDGTEHSVDAKAGISIMENAIANNIDGIEAECGGSCMCATCHCFIEGDIASKLPAMESDEDEMLGFAAEERRPSSRLSCQVKMTDELDGIVVHLPAEQT
jgi:2Fe-2S ferredoxin